MLPVTPGAWIAACSMSAMARSSSSSSPALTAMIPEGFKRPAPVAPSSAAREAAAVRELANSYLKTDPGFAGDLYAAANRHEMQAGH